MKAKKSKGLLVASILVGILTFVGVVALGFSLFAVLTGYGIKIEDAVYFKQSDLVINYSQDDPNKIESYTVKLINTTNKEFLDYEMCLTLYIINGDIDHYPHASTGSKIISINPKEEKTVTFDAGFLTSISLDGYIGESLELEYKLERESVDKPADYEQIYNGKDFIKGVDEARIIVCGLIGFEFLFCLALEIMLIVKYNKSGKKLIHTLIEKKLSK